MPTASETRPRDPANDRFRSIQLDDVSVCFDLPVEEIASLKEYVIRRLQRRVNYREVWALKRVRLSVAQGEGVGVIGRNGAGKSTLLRVMARALRPTSGRIRIWGSVAELIELGAGFHPELTGRENVFLAGTLLGRSTADVRRCFDDIVDFAEIAEFIDAPVRTYSSGMTMRLGFAVATAWDADVLLVDEVLAVGDEAFRQKCVDRIAKLRQRNGTTIVLVSHDVAMITSTCDRAIWLEHGKVHLQGSPQEVTEAYHASNERLRG